MFIKAKFLSSCTRRKRVSLESIWKVSLCRNQIPNYEAFRKDLCAPRAARWKTMWLSLFKVCRLKSSWLKKRERWETLSRSLKVSASLPTIPATMPRPLTCLSRRHPFHDPKIRSLTLLWTTSSGQPLLSMERRRSHTWMSKSAVASTQRERTESSSI